MSAAICEHITEYTWMMMLLLMMIIFKTTRFSFVKQKTAFQIKW